jgi:hypothetical protein
MWRGSWHSGKGYWPEALLPRVQTLGDTLSALGASPGVIYQKKSKPNLGDFT